MSGPSLSIARPTHGRAIKKESKRKTVWKSEKLMLNAKLLNFIRACHKNLYIAST